MPEKHVVFALMERRARLAGDLRAKQAEVLSLKRALASVDLCIRMFKADYQPKAIAPKVTLAKNPANLPKGAGYRKALEILRDTGKPFTAMELAYLALERLGREPSEPAISMLARNDPQQLLPAEEPGRHLRSVNDVAGQMALVAALAGLLWRFDQPDIC